MINIKKNEPLQKYTTFKIGGPAKYFIEANNLEDIKKALTFAKAKKTKVFILGGGSNVLFSDNGFKGIIICTKMAEYVLEGTNLVVDCGLQIGLLVKLMADKGLSGIEFLAGIPGTVGGAVFMNAGQKSDEIKKVVKKVWAVDFNGIEHVFDGKDCGFGYRRSIFQKRKLVIVKVKLQLKKSKTKLIAEKIKEILKNKMKIQPYNLPSAGSFFENPKNKFAAKLIETSGCKGMRVGNAQISEKHANFIVNLNGATSKDVINLYKRVVSIVRNKTGITLIPEVKIL